MADKKHLNADAESPLSTAETPKPKRTRPRFASSTKRKAAALMFEAGISYQRVAEAIDVLPNTVRDWQREYKAGRLHAVLSPNQYRYCQEIKERVIALRAAGMSWRELSEATGVNASTCRRWIVQAQEQCDKS